jgi:hypothetical protein
MDIKQFKLTNGEEIVCEVVEWHDEETADIIIRNSYKVVTYQSATSRDRYHTFTPWMLLQEGDDIFQSINSEQIVGSCSPTEEMLREYIRVKQSKNESDLTHEEMDQKVTEYIEALQQFLRGNMEERKYEILDSDGKVIAFPDRGKVH